MQIMIEFWFKLQRFKHPEFYSYFLPKLQRILKSISKLYTVAKYADNDSVKVSYSFIKLAELVVNVEQL